MSDFRDDEFGEVEPIDDGFGKVEPIKTQNDGFGDVEQVEAEEHPPKSEKPSEEKKDEKPSIPDIPRGFSPTIDMANDVVEEAQRRAAEEPKFGIRREKRSRAKNVGLQAGLMGSTAEWEDYDADTVDSITDMNGGVAKRGEIVEVTDGDPIVGTADGRGAKRRLYEFTGDDENGHPTLRRLTEDEAKGRSASASMRGDVFRRMRGDGRIKMDSSALEQVRQGVLAETGNVDMYGEGVKGQLEAVAARAMPYVGRAFVSKYKKELSALYDLSKGNVGESTDDWWDKISSVQNADKYGLVYRKNDGESDDQYKARISKAAGDELRRRIEAMQEASADLGATEKDAVEKIIGGFIDSSGYALEFAIPGGMLGKAAKGVTLLRGSGVLAKLGNAAVRQNIVSLPVTAAEASSRYTQMTTPGFALDDDGNPYIRDQADTPGNAALKAIGGALIDTNIEIGLEPVAMGMVRGAMKPVGWAFNKWTPQVVKELGAKGYGKFIHSETGRMFHDFSKAFGEFTEITGINSPLGELAEEDVQALEGVIGWDGERSSTRERELREGGFKSEWDQFKSEQMSLKTQADIFLGLIGQMLVGSATSAYRVHEYRNSDAYKNELKNRRDLEGALRLDNVDQDTINMLSDDQKRVLDKMWRHYSSNPDELKAKAKNLSFAMRMAVNEMASRDGVRMDETLRAEGMEPAKFVFSADENGKPAFKHITRLHGDNRTEEMDAMSSGGVTIVDLHDGRFAVMNDWRGSVPEIKDDFGSARAAADNQVMLNQRMDGDNAKKTEYFEKYVAPNYEGRSIRVVQTVPQLREEVLKSVTSGEGYLGTKDAGSIFDENGELRERSAGGFHTPDGTTVLILDNIVSPADMERVTAHEAVGHEGVENQVGRDNLVEFIGGIRANGFSNYAYGQWRKITQDLIRRGFSTEEAQRIASNTLDSDRGRKEIMAKYAEQRRHLPTAMELAQHDENEKRRAAGEDVPTDDADLEVMLWKAEQEARQKREDAAHTKAKPVVQDIESEPVKTRENTPVSAPSAEGMTSQPEAEKPTEGDGGASRSAREDYVSGLNNYSTENDKRFVDVATEDEFAKANELRNKFTDDPSDEALKEFSDYVDGVVAKADEASAKANETAGVKPSVKAENVDDFIEARGDLTDDQKEWLKTNVAKIANPEDVLTVGQGESVFNALNRRGVLMLTDPNGADTSDYGGVPQFKEDVDRKTGVKDAKNPLEGPYKQSLAGYGIVWVKKDGETVDIDGEKRKIVAKQGTGRHRNWGARNSGEKMWNIVLFEQDGWDADKISLLDGISNIKDGKGEVKDYVKFFNDTKFKREDAESEGLLGKKPGDKGRVAWSIYADATDAVRDATDLEGSGAEGSITPEQSSIIAQAAPKDANERNSFIQSNILLPAARRGMRGKQLAAYAKQMVAMAQSDKLNKNLLVGEQMDLFQSEDFQAMNALAEARAKYQSGKAEYYAGVASDIRAALNGKRNLKLGKAMEEFGITDINDRKQLEKGLDEANRLANYWDPTGDAILDKSDTEKMDAEINAKADANAKRREELKAKLAAVKSGKPLPKKAVSKKEATSPKQELDETKKTSEKVVHQKTAENKAKTGVVDENANAKPKVVQPTKPRTVVMKNADEEKKADAALADIDFDTDFDVDSIVLSGDEIRKRMPGYNRLDWRTHVDRDNSFVAPRMEEQFRHLLKTRKGKGDGSVVSVCPLNHRLSQIRQSA